MLLRTALPAMGLLAAMTAQAQPNLTASNDIPLNGDEFENLTVDNFSNDGGIGAPAAWHYWNMLVENTGLHNYRWFNASVSPSSSIIPSATLLSTDGGSDTLYWAVTTNGLEKVGERTNITNATFGYSDPIIELKLPCTYGTTWNDTHAASYTVSGFPVTRTGTMNGHADAHGTLALPQGYVHPNVLRVKLRRQITDASAIITTVRRETVFNYYEEGGRYPRLHLRIDSAQVNGGAWGVTRRAEWRGVGFFVGVDEALTDADVFTAYPNPASDAITVSAPRAAGSRMEIADAAGRVVRSENLTAEQSMLSVAGLPAGVYHLSLIDPVDVRRTQRLVVQ